MIEPTISIIGSGSAEAALAARALLAGNRVAHRWLDTDSDPVGRILREQAGLGADQPVVIFADGRRLDAPAEFVERFPGRSTRGHVNSQADGTRHLRGMTAPART